MLRFLVFVVAIGEATSALEFAGVALNATPLTAVVERFGQAERWDTGDAADSEHKVCYRIATHTELRYVYFIVDELGGGKTVTGVRVSTNGDDRCAVAQHENDQLRAALADYTSWSAADRHLRRLGLVSEKPGQWSRCFRRAIKGQMFDNCTTVHAEWRRGALFEAELWVSETN